MNTSLLKVLSCPYCGGGFTINGKVDTASDDTYAVLNCHCGRYPVVAGIPILKRGKAGASHSVDQIVELIESGQRREALLAAIMPKAPDSATFAPGWIQALPSVRGMGKFKTLMGRPGWRAWQQATETLLSKPPNQVSVSEYFDVYFLQSGIFSRVHRQGSFDYFSLRWGQPRYIVGLALANVLQQSNRPILDLACGFGHHTRHLVRRAQGQLVIGVDHDFLMLYVAKNCIAPGAEYVCAGADISIPMADRSCGFTFCADAFTLFLNQASCMRELRRITAEDGVLALSPIRNGLVKRDLYVGILPQMPPEGFAGMMDDMPYRIVSNRTVMERYLKKQGPALASQTATSELNKVQWLSLVATYRTELFRDYPSFTEWPHTEGERLGINPVYKEQSRDASGSALLCRAFPSAWYEQENGSEDGRFVPESAVMSSQDMSDLDHGNRTPQIDRLIAQGVILGLPDIDGAGTLKNPASMKAFS